LGFKKVNKLKVVIPKGKIQEKVVQLMLESGFDMVMEERNYIPRHDNPGIAIKLMKPQNISQLIELGSHDIGFTGYDWITETGSDVEEILDLGFDPVTLVAAAPEPDILSKKHTGKVVVASEYENLAKTFLDKQDFEYVFLRTYGATEVFPPDDADMIIDNTSTGRTLKEHGLNIVSTLLRSSTRFIANKDALKVPWKKEKIAEMKMLFRSILDAQDRVMLEMNIPGNRFEETIKILPCMRSPTVAKLYNEEGYAVKIAIKKGDVAELLPKLKKMGAADILEYEIRKVIV